MSTSQFHKPPVCSPPPAIQSPPRALAGGAVGRVAAATPVVRVPLRRADGPAVWLHGTFLTIAVLILVASFSFTIHQREKVVIPVVNVMLPGTCTFREVTGVPCPGCGLTRSFISMGNGRIGDAWHYNPAGFLFFAVVVFQIPYRIYQIVRTGRGHAPHRFVRLDSWMWILLVVALLAQWVWQLIGKIG